jgi:hypothetical protein
VTLQTVRCDSPEPRPAGSIGVGVHRTTRGGPRATCPTARLVLRSTGQPLVQRIAVEHEGVEYRQEGVVVAPHLEKAR